MCHHPVNKPQYPTSVTDDERMPMLSWRNPFPRVSVESYVDKGVISAWGTPDSDQQHADIRCVEISD